MRVARIAAGVSLQLVLLASDGTFESAAFAPAGVSVVPLASWRGFGSPSSRPSWRLEMSSATANAESGNKDEEEVSGGSATIRSEIFNLVKSIVGAGVLSLPSGIAAFGNNRSALVPATLLIAAIGAISGYGFSLIGRVCSYTGATSYRDAWARSIGPDTSVIPAASCTFKTTGAALAYSIILADTINALLTTVGVSLSRSNTLYAVTSLVLLPLCLLKNLSSLAPFSLLGIVGMAYTAVAMAVRYFTGAYAHSRPFLADLPSNLRPSFGTSGPYSVFSPSAFILISMLSTAYMAHFNAPKFYTELKDNTIRRYNAVVSTSFATSILIYAAIAALGFSTFGANSNGLILNNYSRKDLIMSLSRVAVTISIVSSYPLAFVGCRDGWLDLAKIKQDKRSNRLLNAMTVTLLTCITGMAIAVKDVGFVLSFGGATLGNALIYVYPALMFRAAVKKMNETGRATKALTREVKFALASACLGVGMGLIGAKMALRAEFGWP